MTASFIFQMLALYALKKVEFIVKVLIDETFFCFCTHSIPYIVSAACLSPRTRRT